MQLLMLNWWSMSQLGALLKIEAADKKIHSQPCPSQNVLAISASCELLGSSIQVNVLPFRVWAKGEAWSRNKISLL